MSDEEREEKELDLSSPEVVTKYKSAAEIVNKALPLVLSECKPKAKIVDLCEKGDSSIGDVRMDISSVNSKSQSKRHKNPTSDAADSDSSSEIEPLPPLDSTIKTIEPLPSEHMAPPIRNSCC